MIQDLTDASINDLTLLGDSCNRFTNAFSHNNVIKGAIQIICDTLGRGGGLTKCHQNFYCFLNLDINVFGGQKSGKICHVLFEWTLIERGIKTLQNVHDIMNDK